MSVANYHIQWVTSDFTDYVLGSINPTWSLSKVKARVSSITKLPDTMVEVRLQPNWLAKRIKPKAGQFVMVTARIDGINHSRAYSLVSASPSEWVIAVKVQGLVSKYLAHDLRAGDVLELGKPQGEFVLDAAPKNKPLLFIAAGSGITPVVSLITQALKAASGQTKRKVTLLYFSRDPVYADVFKRLARAYPQFDCHLVIDTAENPARFTKDTLAEIGIDPSAVHTFLCGAPSLMMAVNDVWRELSLENQLTQERFVSVALENDNLDVATHTVTFRQKQTTFDAKGNLLVSAEAAGLSPAYGCRMGICNTCSCVKVSGTVKNQLTGEVSREANENIKLCISEALSPVELDA